MTNIISGENKEIIMTIVTSKHSVPDRIAALRELMQEKGIDACVVPTGDPHMSSQHHWIRIQQERLCLRQFRCMDTVTVQGPVQIQQESCHEDHHADQKEQALYTEE